MNIETKETNVDSNNPDEWEYEYEYVEVPEGEELPEGDGYEYEYVEAPQNQENIIKPLSSDLDIKADENVLEFGEEKFGALADFIFSNNAEKTKSEVESVSDVESEAVVDDFADVASTENVELDDLGFLGSNTSEDISLDDLISLETTSIAAEVLAGEDNESNIADYDDEVSSFESEVSEIDDFSSSTRVEKFDLEDFIQEPEEDVAVEGLLAEEAPKELVEYAKAEIVSHDLVAKLQTPIQSLDVLMTITDIKNIDNVKIFNKNIDIEIFKAKDGYNSVSTGEIDLASKEAEMWKLIVFDKIVVSTLKSNKETKIPLLEKTVRFAKLVKNGEEKLAFFNDEEFNFISEIKDFKTVDGKFIVGNVDSETNLLINDFINIPLAKYIGNELEFSIPISGMLVAPNASILYFSGINSLIVPKVEGRSSVEENLIDNNLNWYSESEEGKFFNITSSTQAFEIVGDDKKDSIHIQVGISTYGWNVSFDNGVFMSVEDLQKYQHKNGFLPTNIGTLMYGPKKFIFSNIKRIVFYEIPQYFAYGK